MKEEKIAPMVELESVKVESNRVKAELSKCQERVLDLWQENCQQLIEFDNALAENLQLREMELVKWKLSNLSEPAIQGRVSKFPKMASVSGKDSKLVFSARIGDVRTGESLQEDPAPTSTHFIGTRPLSVSGQKGQVYVPSTTPSESLQYKCMGTTIISSHDDLSPLRCMTTTTMSADDFLTLRGKLLQQLTHLIWDTYSQQVTQL